MGIYGVHCSYLDLPTEHKASLELAGRNRNFQVSTLELVQGGSASSFYLDHGEFICSRQYFVNLLRACVAYVLFDVRTP